MVSLEAFWPFASPTSLDARLCCCHAIYGRRLPFFPCFLPYSDGQHPSMLMGWLPAILSTWHSVSPCLRHTTPGLLPGGIPCTKTIAQTHRLCADENVHHLFRLRSAGTTLEQALLHRRWLLCSDEKIGLVVGFAYPRHCDVEIAFVYLNADEWTAKLCTSDTC